MASIQPSELFPDVLTADNFADEIIFIADRSGSMQAKMPSLRDALNVALKSLPGTCIFNIYYFGSGYWPIWNRSNPYKHATLDEAIAHVSTFEADMGGTELLPPLKSAILHRNSSAAST